MFNFGIFEKKKSDSPDHKEEYVPDRKPSQPEKDFELKITEFEKTLKDLNTELLKLE